MEKRREYWEAQAELGVGPLSREPEVFADLRWILNAFKELSGSRRIGMALGGIPFTEISSYAARYRVDDFEEFHRLIHALDEAFLKRIGKRG